MKKETILITGVNGFLGSHLAKSLLKDYEVIGLEAQTEHLHRIKDLPITVYSSKDNMEEIFDKTRISSVLHAATVYRRSDDPIGDVIKTNVLLPAQLYELAEKYQADNFFNTDSFFNAPANRGYLYLKDYTLSKQQAVDWLKIQQKRCRIINMRIFHMYGPDDSPAKFIPFVLNKLMRNENIDLTPGLQERDFIYIDDVVDAYLAVLKASDRLSSGYVEFDVATGENISIKEFVETAKRILGSSSDLNWGALPYRENEIMKTVSDNTSLKDLNWKPGYAIQEGIAKYVKK